MSDFKEKVETWQKAIQESNRLSQAVGKNHLTGFGFIIAAASIALFSELGKLLDSRSLLAAFILSVIGIIIHVLQAELQWELANKKQHREANRTWGDAEKLMLFVINSGSTSKEDREEAEWDLWRRKFDLAQNPFPSKFLGQLDVLMSYCVSIIFIGAILALGISYIQVI